MRFEAQERARSNQDYQEFSQRNQESLKESNNSIKIHKIGVLPMMNFKKD